MKVVWGEEGEVYIPRPLREEKLEPILRKAKKVYMPPSTFQRISKRLREMYRDKIEILSVRGRFSRYSPEVIMEIAALRRSGWSIRKIAKEMGIPPSTVHYLITYLKKIEVEGEKIIL